MPPDASVGKLPFLLHAPAALLMPSKVAVGGGTDLSNPKPPFPNIPSGDLSLRLSHSLVLTGECYNSTWGR